MEIVVAASIDAFTPDEWNRLFPGELEDWSYYRAAERSGLSGFEWMYFGVRTGSLLCAVIPAFLTDFRLDTTLDGWPRRIIGALSGALPRLLRPRMLALGSPVTETCHAGFAACMDESERLRVLGRILDACDEQAARCGASLLAIKDAADGLSAAWAGALHARGMRRQPSEAIATLALPYRSTDAYLATLGRATRRGLRRKQRSRGELRIEWRRELDGIRDQVTDLYLATLERAAMRLEVLTPDYFDLVLRELGERAACVCYWSGDALVAFNLVLHDGDRLIDKYIGMDYRHARRLNLYYVSWMENVRYAIERGIPVYQSGQGLSDEKRRLGSTLMPNWLWYRHRNRVMNGAMRGAEAALGLGRRDIESAATRHASA